MFPGNLVADLLEKDFIDIWHAIENETRSVSSCLILKGERSVYYFLVANDPERISIGASTLLIQKIAEYYHDQSEQKAFFLGAGQTGVYEFKRGFSDSRLPYYIGSKVHNQKMFDLLSNKSGNSDNGFFPKYRKKII